MRRALAARIDKLETARKPIVRVPNVLRVERGETSDDARRRFGATYGRLPRGQSLLIVPAPLRTADDEADFEARFAAQQHKLVSDARSERMKETE